MLSNTIVKIFMVFLFAMPAVIVGGELYSVITGEPQWEGLLKVGRQSSGWHAQTV